MSHGKAKFEDCLAEKHLIESILNSVRDPIVAVLTDRNVVWMNRSARELTPCPSTQASDNDNGAGHWICHTHDAACDHAHCLVDLVEPDGRHGKLLREYPSGDGTRRMYEVIVGTLAGPGGQPMGLIKTLRDITEHHNNLALLNERERALKQIVQRDPLTGLANREMARERIHYAISQAARFGNMVGLLYFDLVGFKKVNDSIGHDAGDLVLKKLAHRVTSIVRDCDTVARLGGDEFLIILDRLKQTSDAGTVAEKLMDALKEPFKLQARAFQISASIGISLYPTDGSDAETLIHQADMAMYRAKRSGSRAAHYASLPDQTLGHPAPHGEQAIRQALEHAREDEFSLLYQPIVDLADNRIVKVEALLRWHSKDHGLLTPDRFLSVAEKSNLIYALDDWVLLTVCQQYVEWRRQGFKLPAISVNLSSSHLARGDLPDRLSRILALTGCPPEGLELELAESLILEDTDQTQAMLGRLKQLGVSLSIDDFGAGYTSLTHLKLLPITHLKIDRSLVRQLPAAGRDADVARAIVAMAQSLNMKIVAKGIETQGQRDFLKAEGFDQGQGFYCGKPLSSERLRRQLPH